VKSDGVLPCDEVPAMIFFCFRGFSFTDKARGAGREVVCSVLGNRIFESGGKKLRENSFTVTFTSIHAA
jgi:hypothetical protein